jgi:hypothetical protein
VLEEFTSLSVDDAVYRSDEDVVAVVAKVTNAPKARRASAGITNIRVIPVVLIHH